MSTSRGILIIAALFCVGLYASVYRTVSSGDHAITVPGGRRDAPRDTSTFAGPSPAAAADSVPTAHLDARPSRSPEPALASAVDPRVDPEARAEQARAHRDYMTALEAAYRSELVDPRWSAAATATVQAAVATNALGAAIRDVACRARSCRIALSEDGTGLLAKAMPLLIHQLGGELPSVAADRQVDPSGAASIVLYMSR